MQIVSAVRFEATVLVFTEASSGSRNAFTYRLVTRDTVFETCLFILRSRDVFYPKWLGSPFGVPLCYLTDKGHFLDNYLT